MNFDDIFQELGGQAMLDREKATHISLLCATLPNRSLCVEIGVFCGASAAVMARSVDASCGLVHAIDPWISDTQYEEPANKKFWEDDHRMDYVFRTATVTLSAFNNVSMIRSKSEDVVDEYEDESIDLLHIDGNHTEAASLRDCKGWFSKVKQGGIIILDDLDWQELGELSQVKSIDYLSSVCQLTIYKGKWGIWKK